MYVGSVGIRRFHPSAYRLAWTLPGYLNPCLRLRHRVSTSGTVPAELPSPPFPVVPPDICAFHRFAPGFHASRAPLPVFLARLTRFPPAFQVWGYRTFLDLPGRHHALALNGFRTTLALRTRRWRRLARASSEGTVALQPSYCTDETSIALKGFLQPRPPRSVAASRFAHCARFPTTASGGSRKTVWSGVADRPLDEAPIVALVRPLHLTNRS